MLQIYCFIEVLLKINFSQFGYNHDGYKLMATSVSDPFDFWADPDPTQNPKTDPDPAQFSPILLTLSKILA